ncbi:uncharacterized protein H6S33_011806 [Morchella sextelata]|uniref:uncharacterized protein n=1 Tax=Morchella sextelata TaxID=1174677 RepID=UPI001D03617A|nr:uncharacterized protein H6S33_011806 [Morchella sextelata]KAH0610279.1 hypothetical protein H6S33_011806 [Morchella sextelata]
MNYHSLKFDHATPSTSPPSGLLIDESLQTKRGGSLDLCRLSLGLMHLGYRRHFSEPVGEDVEDVESRLDGSGGRGVLSHQHSRESYGVVGGGGERAVLLVLQVLEVGSRSKAGFSAKAKCTKRHAVVIGLDVPAVFGRAIVSIPAVS